MHIHIDDIGETEYFIPDSYASALLTRLGYYDRRSKATNTLYNIIRSELRGQEPYRLEPGYVKGKDYANT